MVQNEKKRKGKEKKKEKKKRASALTFLSMHTRLLKSHYKHMKCSLCNFAVNVLLNLKIEARPTCLLT